MGIENCLNLCRINVEARSDNQLLRAAGNEQRIAFETGQIARIEPALLSIAAAVASGAR